MQTHLEQTLRQGDCYKLLAACFYEPEKDLFIEEGLCENLAALLSAESILAATKATAAMRASLFTTNEEQLQVIHAGLFIGPFELAAPPYGSVYLERGRRLMGDSTLAVQKAYRDAGFSLDVQEAPDHIALELEFMHLLCGIEAEAATKKNNNLIRESVATRSRFLLDYLAPWVPEFCDAIRKGTENEFYRGAADCLEGFIATMASRRTAEILSRKEDGHVCEASL